ncbi:hypothetical protein B0H34DRAFT_676536 [Crassisporium funariophilum]|nr:hypothetical protein B0H34DRAFT_676536 [Crassisporium funariophilum]
MGLLDLSSISVGMRRSSGFTQGPVAPWLTGAFERRWFLFDSHRLTLLCALHMIQKLFSLQSIRNITMNDVLAMYTWLGAEPEPVQTYKPLWFRQAAITDYHSVTQGPLTLLTVSFGSSDLLKIFHSGDGQESLRVPEIANHACHFDDFLSAFAIGVGRKAGQRKRSNLGYAIHALPSLLTTKPVHHPCLQFNRNRGPPECPETMYRRPPNAIALRRQAGDLPCPPERPKTTYRRPASAVAPRRHCQEKGLNRLTTALLPPHMPQDDVSTSGDRCRTLCPPPQPSLPPHMSQDDVSTSANRYRTAASPQSLPALPCHFCKSGERCCTTAALCPVKWSKPPDHGAFCQHTGPRRCIDIRQSLSPLVSPGLSPSCLPPYTTYKLWQTLSHHDGFYATCQPLLEVLYAPRRPIDFRRKLPQQHDGRS